MRARPPRTGVARPAAPPTRGGTLGLGVALLTGTAAYILPFGALATVILPARIAEEAPTDKVGLLAVLAAATAAAGMVGNLVFGAFSDRTRTRVGARVPWLLGGAVAAAILMLPLATASGFVPLLVWWCLAVAAVNATVVAVAALLPDRVPPARRGTMAAVAGIGNLLGVALGTLLGAALPGRDGLGVPATAGLLVALAVVAAVAARGRSNLDTPPRPLDLRSALGAFRPPRGAPDFYRAMGGRLLLVVGYFVVRDFQLYIFTDHVGLDGPAAAHAVALNSVIVLGAALVGAAVAGPASDRCRRRRPFVTGGAALFCVAALVPLVAPTELGMIGFSATAGLAVGVVQSVDAALMTEVLPSAEARARDLGFLNVATTGGQVLAPAAGSALVGLGYGFAPVFVGAMIACGLGAGCIQLIRSVR